jgi:hypothetical protein
MIRLITKKARMRDEPTPIRRRDNWNDLSLKKVVLKFD